MNGVSFDAVIFDCDGTLVDSETLGIEVLVDYVATFGLRLSFEQALHDFTGQRMSDIVSSVETQLERPLPGTFVNELRTRMATRFKRDLKPMPGALRLVQSLRRPMSVASSAPVEKIRLSLQLTDLLSHFEGRIFSAYEIQSWKPEPDLFLWAASEMRVEPSHCAVIEDSIVGVRAGLAAGMRVFALNTPRLEEAESSRLTRISHLDELVEVL